MSNARFFSAIALTAVVTGTLVAGLTLSRPAHADPPRTATCGWRIPGAPDARSGSPKLLDEHNSALQAWMAEQMAAGRTQFGTMPAPDVYHASLCAW